MSLNIKFKNVSEDKIDCFISYESDFKIITGLVTINSYEEKVSFDCNLPYFIAGFYGGINALESEERNIRKQIAGIGFWDGGGSYDFKLTKSKGKLILKDTIRNISFEDTIENLRLCLDNLIDKYCDGDIYR